MIGLWLSAFLYPTPDQCWGSLLWWTLHYTTPAVVLTAGVMGTNLIAGVMLTTQLYRTVQMERAERIAASKVVYSLGINVVILVSPMMMQASRSLTEVGFHTPVLDQRSYERQRY